MIFTSLDDDVGVGVLIQVIEAGVDFINNVEGALSNFVNDFSITIRGFVAPPAKELDIATLKSSPPDARLLINNDPLDLMQPSTSENDRPATNCDPEQSDRWHVATAQMILALSCATTVLNNTVASILKKMGENGPREVSAFFFKYC